MPPRGGASPRFSDPVPESSIGDFLIRMLPSRGRGSLHAVAAEPSMSRLVLCLPVVASVIVLGAGCPKRAKPVSEFARTCDVPETFSAVAKQTGVTQEGFTF